MLNAAKKIRRLIQWKLFLKNNFHCDKWYFVLNYGIGDTYLVSSLIPYIVDRYKDVEFIIEKADHRFIPALFSEAIQTHEDILLPFNLIKEFGQFIKGNPIVLHPLNMLNGNIVQMIGYKDFNLLDMYKTILGLDMLCKPVFPVFKKKYFNEVSEIFTYAKLNRGKTVLICPQANSVNLVDNDFWLGLAKNISSTGLTPVFLNTNLGSEFVKVEFPLVYAKAFVDFAGYVISLRSGFCDLISTTTAKKIIVYPDEKWFSGKLIDSTSLLDLNLCNESSLCEIVLSTSEPDYFSTTQKILSQIK